MSKMVMLTVGGYVPAESKKYMERVVDIDSDYLMEKLPQMLKCIYGDFVQQIEDPTHPFNGWEVLNVLIEEISDEVETPQTFIDPSDDDDDEGFEDGEDDDQ